MAGSRQCSSHAERKPTRIIEKSWRAEQRHGPSPLLIKTWVDKSKIAMCMHNKSRRVSTTSALELLAGNSGPVCRVQKRGASAGRGVQMTARLKSALFAGREPILCLVGQASLCRFERP